MTDALMKRFRVALDNAAKQKGIDASIIQWQPATMERTWGDRVGYVFFVDTDVSESRAAFLACWAAKTFERWYPDHAPEGSYGAQRSIGFCGRFHYVEFNNGAKGWYRGQITPFEPRPPMEDGWRLERIKAIPHGWGVATTYYPCAD